MFFFLNPETEIKVKSPQIHKLQRGFLINSLLCKSHNPSPHGVEQRAVILQPQQLVRRGHVVRDGFLAVQEEGVRSPDVAGQQVVQGQHPHGPFETQALILPALAEKHINGVLLRRDKRNEIR